MPTKGKWPYNTSQWRRVRPIILERDGYRCQIRDDKCLVEATEVDHKIPVEQGGAPFDLENLRAACRPCNVARANRGRNERWRSSRTEIVLVVGPPGSGKSTLVESERSVDDVVIDYDRIAEAVGSDRSHGHASAAHSAAMAARAGLLSRLRQGKIDAPRVWLISTNPKAEQMFPYHRVVVVDPGEDEVVRRAEAAGRPGSWRRLIADWYRQRKPAQPSALFA